jgi:hypothetical protein
MVVSSKIPSEGLRGDAEAFSHVLPGSPGSAIRLSGAPIRKTDILADESSNGYAGSELPSKSFSPNVLFPLHPLNPPPLPGEEFSISLNVSRERQPPISLSPDPISLTSRHLQLPDNSVYPLLQVDQLCYQRSPKDTDRRTCPGKLTPRATRPINTYSINLSLSSSLLPPSPRHY